MDTGQGSEEHRLTCLDSEEMELLRQVSHVSVHCGERWDRCPHSHTARVLQRDRAGDLKGIYTPAMVWEDSELTRGVTSSWPGVFVQQRTPADPDSVIEP